jgi:uncharacterized lipoprotein YmbA
MRINEMIARLLLTAQKSLTVKFFLVFAILFLAACKHSPRKEYYALSAPAAEYNVNDIAAVNQAVGIGPINVPEYLHHNKIGYWKTPQQLALLDNHYWAEPLEQGIVRVLALQLQAKQPNWRVQQFPWSNNQRPNYSLRVDIQRLDAFANYAILEANIDWVNLETRQVIGSQRIKVRQDSFANAASIAQTFSELLQQAVAAVDTSSIPNADANAR